MHKADDGDQLHDIVLRVKDKRLCMGALGHIDGRPEESNARVVSAFSTVSDSLALNPAIDTGSDEGGSG